MEGEIKIRPLNSADKSALAEHANNKNVWDNLRDYIPFPYDENDGEYFINLTIKESPQQNFGIEYEGELCEVIGLTLKSNIYRKSAELGYWIGEAYWGKGIATEAVRLINEYGFGKLELNRIFSGVFSNNFPSMRVLEKNGFQKEGIFKNAVIKNDKVLDEHRFYNLNKW